MRVRRPYRDIDPAPAVSCVVMVVALALGQATAVGAERTRDLLPFSRRIDEGVELAARYLVVNCGQNGRFAYRRSPRPDHLVRADYNLLRHAGAIYALGCHYRRRPSAPVAHAMVRAATFLKEGFLARVPAHPGALAIWRDERALGLGPRGAQSPAKLGGAGLALVAFCSLPDGLPNPVTLADLRGLGRFILLMQKSDGSFHSKFFPESGPNDDWVSLYYPGEAILGLCMLYDSDPDPVWLAAAAKGMAYLARSRRGMSRVPPDHWALIATEWLMERHNRIPSPPPTSALVGHARQVCEAILGEQVLTSAFPEIIGGFGEDGRTCPAATRLEGLIAACKFLPDDDGPLLRRIGLSCRAGVLFLLNSQYQVPPLAGGMPFSAVRLPHTPEQAGRAARNDEVRVDYVQHALSALIQFDDLFLAPLRDDRGTGSTESTLSVP